MNKLQGKKQVNRLAILFATTYMVSYMTRINYGAIISEMATATSFSKSQLSMALTGSFFTYGVGMIISGIIGDRVSPKKLVSLGLSVSVFMNILIPLCQKPYIMLIVWCINGFAQSFMWPPLVRLMTTLLTEEDYKKTTAKVAWGSSFGTIVVYLLSPALISLSGWQSVFFFSATCGILMILVWNKFSYEIENENKRAMVNGKKIEIRSVFTPLMICVMVVIVLQGMLRDGITTWMPSYISETYNLSNVISILTGIILPIFSIICFQITTRMYINKFKNPITCASVLWGASLVAAFGLILFTGRNAGFSVLFSAVLTGCMHGVNLMLNSMIPPFFANTGNVSTVSGVLNSCTYVGSAISTYGIALLSEKFGWSFVLIIWIAIAIVGTLISVICTKPFEKQLKLNSIKF